MRRLSLRDGLWAALTVLGWVVVLLALIGIARLVGEKG